ncbi:unnamed protein product [Musa acuminata subsp. malaccensis]|uniref:(wild Malaysian banana) hypothetical protein n=1 Tax=Musa acuminata subsp. malaccensis TaxID=214687 RepID=A0A804KBV4_MUSAM|nr:unnamed protein product [Musa acuminata subsp. malaccensis]
MKRNSESTASHQNTSKNRVQKSHHSPRDTNRRILRMEEREDAHQVVVVVEGDAGGFGAEGAVVELVVEAVGDPDRLAGVAVLDDDEVVGLEEGASHLQEVQVADRRHHDVELVLEQGSARRRRRRQGRPAHHVRRSHLSSSPPLSLTFKLCQ